MIKTAAKIFGVVFVAVGILGFIPAFTPNQMLLGLFHVNTLHNIVHLGSGLVAWLMSRSERLARTYFQIFGIVYLIVTVLGVVYGESDIFGVLANNIHDEWLHLLIAGSALYLGFRREKGMEAT